MTPEELLRWSTPAGTVASGLGKILDQPELGTVGQGLGDIGSLYNFGTSVASGDPGRAVGGAISGASGLANLFSNVPGLENLTSAIPYLGPLASLFRFGNTAAGGDPASILSAVPGLAASAAPVAASGALGATMAAAAPALSTVGAFAIPAAAAAYFATNTARKDAERRQAELHEWKTARRDLPTTMRQLQGAVGAHRQMGDDPSALSDEQLRSLTGLTQTGLLSLNPAGHALMQLQSGEEFAGIPGTDISTPQALTKLATLTGGRDYLRQADEFARRGLTLGGDPTTAMHGSIYDAPEQQWAVNAPNAADMLKDWAIQFDPTSAEAKKVNQLLDASRVGTAEGGAIEKLAIPGFDKGHYTQAFDDFTKNILAAQPVTPPTPAEDPMWAGGVYRGPNPNEYRPYGGTS